MKEVMQFENSKWLWIADNHKKTKKKNDFFDEGDICMKDIFEDYPIILIVYD